MDFSPNISYPDLAISMAVTLILPFNIQILEWWWLVLDLPADKILLIFPFILKFSRGLYNLSDHIIPEKREGDGPGMIPLF